MKKRQKDDPREKHQAETLEKHQGAWDADLNPNAMAGQNIGLDAEAHPEKRARNAYDFKPAHRMLRDFSDDELKQIHILPPGSRLQQNATYVDLKDPRRRTFTARGDMRAGQENWYVPKDDVPYWIWNRLIGIEDTSRLDLAPE